MKISPALNKIPSANSKASGKTINRNLKQLSDDKIVELVKCIFDSSEDKESNVWKLAGFAFNELSIRLWGKRHRKTLESFRQTIMRRSSLCLSRRSYAMEAAGLIDKRTDKIYHPYPFDKTARKIFEKWNASSTNKSLQDYIASYATKKEKETIRHRTVKYVSSKKQGDYLVRFEDRNIVIGRKMAKDGTYIFAYTNDDERQVLLAGIKKKGKFQHSSFFAGAPLACVGEFTVKDKQITKIRLSSGHYHPAKKHSEALMSYLKQSNILGIKAENIKVVLYNA